MVQPHLIINWFAIVACIISGMVFGFLWYGPIFGKVWAKGMGLPFDPNCDTPAFKKRMRKSMTLQVISLFLIAYVLAHTGQVWRPSVWGLGSDGVVSNCKWGFMSAFFTWIGFYVPMQFSKVAWEQRSWKIFFINAGHDFINLFIFSEILAYWR